MQLDRLSESDPLIFTVNPVIVTIPYIGMCLSKLIILLFSLLLITILAFSSANLASIG
jgi:hypothetical protein